MGKIHTHYDNLKVARAAPQEVIRAAYKVLSQKYHPDKNPGDDKAARVMALINSAYGTLADPTRRKEHDEWIAAEEWELDHSESAKRRAETHTRTKSAPPRATRRRDWKWWCGMVACFSLGGLGGALTQSKFKLMPATLALAWGSEAGAETAPAKVATGLVIRAQPKPEPEPLHVAPAPLPAAQPEIKIAAVSQVILPVAPPVCDEAPVPLTPNGEPWPQRSGLVAGLPVGNRGSDMQLTVDNGGNAAPMLVKLYDLERRTNVRYLFILPHDKLVVDQLAFGKYEVRYQKIDLGGSAGEGCGSVRGSAPSVQSAS
jgi:hypothetical protein